MNTDILQSYMLAVFLLALAPGPDLLYVLSLSVSRGITAAIATALGLVSGLLVHTALVIVGLAEILKRFPQFKTGLIYLGATYLFYLAIRGFGQKSAGSRTVKVTEGWSKDYKRGVVMNLLNPKVSLFFLAFFPGFLFHQSWSIQKQFGLMGVLFMLISLVVFTGVALLGARLSRWLHKGPGSKHFPIRYISPTVLFLLAGYLLLQANS